MPPRIKSPTPDSDEVDELESPPPQPVAAPKPAAAAATSSSSKLKLTVTQSKQQPAKHAHDDDDDEDDELSSLPSSSAEDSGSKARSKGKRRQQSTATTRKAPSSSTTSKKRKRPPTPSEDEEQDMLEDDEDEDEDDGDDGGENYSDELDDDSTAAAQDDDDAEFDDDDDDDDDAEGYGSRRTSRAKAPARKTKSTSQARSNKRQKTTATKTSKKAAAPKQSAVKIKFKLGNETTKSKSANKKAKKDDWLVPDDEMDDDLEGADSDTSMISSSSTGSAGVRKTARQRAKEQGGSGWADHMSLSNAVMSRKPELTEAEKADQRAEKARKRLSQKEAKLEDEKTETINRLLKKQVGGGRGGSRTPKTQDDADPASDGLTTTTKTGGLNASRQRTIVTPSGPPTMIRYVSSIKSGEYKNVIMVPEVSGYVQSQWGAVPKVGGYERIVDMLSQGKEPVYPPKTRPPPVTRKLNASS
ncbi:hypothetical protein ACM66B_002230 [Microbotryomycetes sp. NB124-2]